MEINLTQIYSLAFPKVKKEFADNIFNNHAFLAKMKQTGSIVYADGGKQIEGRAMYAAEDGQWASKGDPLNTQNKDAFLPLGVDWRTLYVPVEIWGDDKRKVSGESAITNYIKKKTEWAQESTGEVFTTALFNDGSDSKALEGMRKVIADDPTTGAVAGLDPATYSWWRNAYNSTPWGSSTVGGAATIQFNTSNAGRTAMTRMYQKISWGSRPNLIITDDVAAVEHVLALLATMQTQVTSQKEAQWNIPVAGYYFDCPVVPDKQCPLDGSNYSRMYFINTKYLELYISEQANFSLGAWKMAQDNDKEVAHIITMCNILPTSRRHQGVLYGIY